MATRIPPSSMAKTSRPPSTSTKSAMSAATSRLGVYRKSSPSKPIGSSIGPAYASAFGPWYDGDTESMGGWSGDGQANLGQSIDHVEACLVDRVVSARVLPSGDGDRGR